MKPADAKGYCEMITRFLKLKKEGRLMKGDVEPRPEDFGLIQWAADRIKERVEREMNR